MREISSNCQEIIFLNTHIIQADLYEKQFIYFLFKLCLHGHKCSL